MIRVIRSISFIVTMAIFIVFTLHSNCFAMSQGDIAVESVFGQEIKAIIKLFEPKGSDNLIGTLECIGTDGGSGRFYFRRLNLEGIEINRAPEVDGQVRGLAGPFGGIEPLYDEAEEKITGFRCFASRRLGLGTTQLWTFYMDAELTFLHEARPRWPADSEKMYQPYSMITFSDGSYMIFSSDCKKFYMSRFNADDTIAEGWPEMKELDISAQSGGYIGSMSNIRTAKISDNEIIVCFVARSDQEYNLFIAKIDGNGEHLCPPLANYNNINLYDDSLGDIVLYQDDIIIIANTDGVDESALYYLRLNQDFEEVKSIRYTSSTTLVSMCNSMDLGETVYVGDGVMNFEFNPRRVSINPEGIIYICGAAGSSNGEYRRIYSMLIMIHADDGSLANEGIIIKDLQVNPGETWNNSLGAIIWTPTGAIAGGRFGDKQAMRVVYTAPPPPDPLDIDNDGDGFTENQGDCNDSDNTIYPGAPEICGDGIDQDCDGEDLICPLDPSDIDDDNDGFTENQGDCNDCDDTIYPGAPEICGDGIDQDCDGEDLICPLDPSDIDDDNDGFTENQGDCNDCDDTIYPGAPEICGDGINQDCDGEDLICPIDPLGDFDCDGYLDRNDYQIIREAHLIHLISGSFDPKYDLNGDGYLNVLDLRTEVNLINSYQGGE